MKDYFDSNPDLVLEPLNNTKILVIGMKSGEFTGKKLDEFLDKTKTDFLGARKVLNLNMEDALDYAEIAQKIMDA